MIGRLPLTREELHDARIIRSLWLLTECEVTEFLDHTDPPPAVRQTIRRADATLVRGLLIETLQRWHELREA